MNIAKGPIAWIDSKEASTTTHIQPYLTMLKSIVKIYKKYFQPNKQSDEFSAFIDALDANEFNKVLDNIPSNILNKEPAGFTNYDKITAADLRTCLQ